MTINIILNIIIMVLYTFDDFPCAEQSNVGTKITQNIEQNTMTQSYE